jgi:hypothetical protein
MDAYIICYRLSGSAAAAAAARRDQSTYAVPHSQRVTETGSAPGDLTMRRTASLLEPHGLMTIVFDKRHKGL